MIRRLNHWLGYDREPLEEIVGGLSDPEAKMWAEALRQEGTVVVKSASPLVGYGGAWTTTDFSLRLAAGHAHRAREILTPLLQTHAQTSRQPRRFRRHRERD